MYEYSLAGRLHSWDNRKELTPLMFVSCSLSWNWRWNSKWPGGKCLLAIISPLLARVDNDDACMPHIPATDSVATINTFSETKARWATSRRQIFVFLLNRVLHSPLKCLPSLLFSSPLLLGHNCCQSHVQTPVQLCRLLWLGAHAVG